MFTQSCGTDILHLEQGAFHFYIHLKIKLCCACETKIKFIFIVADGCLKPHKAVLSQPGCFIKRIPFIMQESVCQLNVLPVVKGEWEAPACCLEFCTKAAIIESPYSLISWFDIPSTIWGVSTWTVSLVAASKNVIIVMFTLSLISPSFPLLRR